MIPPKFAPLFAGQRAGAYALPDDIVALVDASERLDRHATGLGSERAKHNAGELSRQLADTILDAAVAGQSLDAGESSAEAVIDAQRRADALEALIAATSAARSNLSNDIEAAVYDERIVTEGLAPAFDELLDAVREVAPALRGVDVSEPASLIGANAATTKAYRTLEAPSARLAAIKTGQRIATGHAQDDGMYSTFTDPIVVWGREWGGRRARTYRPWPEHPYAYLLWLATSPEASAGKPAILTVAQREQLYREYVEANRNGQPGVLGATVAA